MLDIITVYHQFNLFLGTEGGELFRRAIEFIILLFATYMIVSEYKRNRARQLRYMLFAFSALLIARAVEIGLLMLSVFSDHNYLFSSLYFPVINEMIELFALIMLANSFLYPLYHPRLEGLKSKVRFEVIGTVIIAGFSQLLWILTYVRTGGLFVQELGFFLFQVAEILVLLIAIYILIFSNRRYNYRYSVVIALAVYAVNPFLNIINALAFDMHNLNLILIAYPFPVLSVLLIARVIYLKLSDKAYLKEQLIATHQKYVETQEMSKLKDEFLSMVSHELRTPLTSINLYLGLLNGERMGRLNRKQKNAVRVVKEESARLSNMINDILTLNKLEADKMHLNLGKFDLHRFVNDTLYLSMAEKKKIKVVNKIPPKTIVRADEERLKQVFVNLFTNSVKFTDPGGKIILDSRIYPDSFVFEITDTGKGMSKEELDHIFDKFYQVEHILTRHLGGTGLGLAIVKQLIDLHNGAIDVESEVGKGTTFTIIIPQL